MQKLILLATLSLFSFRALAQSTAFTYQGRLNDGGAPANGNYDLRFTVYDSTNSPGVLIAGPITNTATAVSNGLFTVALDFGSAPFEVGARGLEIAARPSGGGAFTVLNPRQALTAAPYAILSLKAGLAYSVQLGSITTTSLADGAVTGAKIAPGAVSQLGAADGSPVNAVQVDTNGLVGIGTNAPRAGLDVTTGGPLLAPQVLFQVQDETGNYTNLAGARTIAVLSNFVAVGSITDHGVTLLDVANPQIPNILAQFRDGVGVYTNISYPSVAMKSGLLAVAGFIDDAVTLISISNPAAPVKLAELRDGVGGWDGLNGAYSMAISGNLLAIAAYDESAITLADISNQAAPIQRIIIRDNQFGFNSLATPYSLALSGNTLAVGANGDDAVTLINIANPASPVLLATLVDGTGAYTNLNGVIGVAISGNLLAIAADLDGVVTLVDITTPASPVKLAELKAGRDGAFNGPFNVAFSGNNLAVSTTAGRVTLFDVSNPSSPRLLAEAADGVAGVEFLAGVTGISFVGTNLVALGQQDNALNILAFKPQAAGIVSQGWVGIGTALPQAALNVVGSVVVEQADVLDVNAQRLELGQNSVAGGVLSSAFGYANRALGNYSTALGNSTVASGDFATALGVSTVASGDYATALGNSTVARGYGSAAFGSTTLASGNYATALGVNTVASGGYSFAAGRNAQAANQGAFVWADSQTASFNSTANNQFLIRAAGGVGINTNNPRGALDVNTGAGAIVMRNDGGLAPGLTVVGAVTPGVLRLRDAMEIWPDEGATRSARFDVRRTNGVAAISLPAAGNAYLNGGNVGIGTTSPQDSILDVEGAMHINDFDLYLRAGAERNHGLGYRASMAGLGGEGPLLYGFNGGALGVGNPDTSTLTWSWDGHVVVSNSFSAVNIMVDRLGANAGSISPGLRFGGGNTGEGIASKRTATGNQNGLDFYTAFQNRLSILNNGRVGIGTVNPASELHVIGTVTATAFNPPSDRNLKENFKLVDAREVLEKVVALPISRWNFKEDSATPHVGPMAQDFHAAFGLGTDERHIATVDADGVALAAIQGLNRKLTEELQRRDAENAELKRRLERLEARMSGQTTSGSN